MRCRRRAQLFLLAIMWAAGAHPVRGVDDDAAQPCPSAGNPDLAAVLRDIREKHRVPAVAGAIVTREGVAAMAAVGVRKRGTNVPAALDDRWHIGSDTKAMTAALIAKLVEQGLLSWDTTIAEIFPEVSSGFHPDMRGVTMLHLLSHRSGLPPNPNLIEYLGDSGPEERLRAVEQELAKAPQHPPGAAFEYSNLGYVIAGAAVEKLTGEPWQKNMADRVFGPLKMKHTGFGGVGTPGEIDQPWGHHAVGMPVVQNGPAMDNPPVMGPAGRVHCTLEDWAAFIADLLRGIRGEPALLKKSSYETLLAPPFGGDYALGWGVTEREWGGGKVLNHCGSNTMNFSNAWVAPERGFAVLVCINQGGDAAFKASDEAAAALIAYYESEVAKGLPPQEPLQEPPQEKPEEAPAEEAQGKAPETSEKTSPAPTVDTADIQIRDPFIYADRKGRTYYGAFHGRLIMALHQPNTAELERLRLFQLHDDGETLDIVAGPDRK